MNANPIGPHLTVILEKMFEAVGEKYSPDKVSDLGWFMNHKWTRAQENDFGKWMVEYLYRNHKDACREFGLFQKNIPLIKKHVKFFLFNYGWTTKEEK